MVEWWLIEQITTKHNQVLILHKHSFCCAKQKIWPALIVRKVLLPTILSNLHYGTSKFLGIQFSNSLCRLGNVAIQGWTQKLVRNHILTQSLAWVWKIEIANVWGALIGIATRLKTLMVFGPTPFLTFVYQSVPISTALTWWSLSRNKLIFASRSINRRAGLQSISIVGNNHSLVLQLLMIGPTSTYSLRSSIAQMWYFPQNNYLCCMHFAIFRIDLLKWLCSITGLFWTGWRQFSLRE